MKKYTGKYQGKTHMRDDSLDPDKYKGSPHVFSAINEGLFSLCGHIPDKEKITIDENKVTCMDCLKFYNSQIIRGYN